MERISLRMAATPMLRLWRAMKAVKLRDHKDFALSDENQRALKLGPLRHA